MAQTEQGHPPTGRPARRRIPRFKTLADEAAFWDTHSTTEFEDEFEEVTGVQFVVAQGRPKKAITVRLDETALAGLTRRARQKGVGPSTLARMWILEHLRAEEERSAQRPS